MIKRSNEEIWYWYEHIEAMKVSGVGIKPWCDVNGVDSKQMNHMLYRICWKSRTDPQTYERMVPLTKKYLQSRQQISKFCRENKTSIRLVSECATHLNYLEIIEKMKEQKKPQPMNFIQMPSLEGALPRPPIQYKENEAEVVEKQNDLEINIAKGVKVVISPNLDSMKIIKIIELLKDL